MSEPVFLLTFESYHDNGTPWRLCSNLDQAHALAYVKVRTDPEPYPFESVAIWILEDDEDGGHFEEVGQWYMASLEPPRAERFYGAGDCFYDIADAIRATRS